MSAAYDYEDRYARSNGSTRFPDDEPERRHSDGKPFDEGGLGNKDYWTRTIYDYVLPDGTMLYQQCRYDPVLRANVDAPKKKFLPRRPVEDGRFVFGPGRRRIIYNWPAIVRAGPGALVFVTEGEKNADELIKHGLLATTVISHVWGPECIAALTGYDVVLLEDHDDNGRRITADAYRKLAPVATVRIVPYLHLWHHLPEEQRRGPYDTEDVSDWIRQGGIAAKLPGICREIPADNIVTVLPHDFPDQKTLAPWDWLYGRHLLRATVSGTAAMGGTGKSTKAIVEALAMASGKSLLGVQETRPLRVCLINLEDNRLAVNKRIAAAMKHYQLEPADIGERLFVKAKGEIKLKIADNLTAAPWLATRR